MSKQEINHDLDQHIRALKEEQKAIRTAAEEKIKKRQNKIDQLELKKSKNVMALFQGYDLKAIEEAAKLLKTKKGRDA